MRAGHGPRAADDRAPVYPAGTKLYVIRQGMGRGRPTIAPAATRRFRIGE